MLVLHVAAAAVATKAPSAGDLTVYRCVRVRETRTSDVRLLELDTTSVQDTEDMLPIAAMLTCCNTDHCVAMRPASMHPAPCFAASGSPLKPSSDHFFVARLDIRPGIILHVAPLLESQPREHLQWCARALDHTAGVTSPQWFEPSSPFTVATLAFALTNITSGIVHPRPRTLEPALIHAPCTTAINTGQGAPLCC